jgi:serine/threonine protein kinase
MSTGEVRLYAGDVVDRRFTVERSLASGGMGSVYVAKNSNTGERVALKVMHPDMVQNADLRKKFEREARIFHMVEDNDHLVRVNDAGIDPERGIPFLVMEFLTGADLGHHFKQRGIRPEGEGEVRRFTPEELVPLLNQVASGLDAAHAKGVYHRDIKPDNIFIVQKKKQSGPHFQVKILDFGIARVSEGVTKNTNMVGGTALYMAPEQTSKSAAIGPGSDIFPLGLIAYQALVGRTYWEGDDTYSLFGEILAPEYEAASVRSARHGFQLGPEFDAFFGRCVARRLDDRFRSASEAIQVLADAYGISNQSVIHLREVAKVPDSFTNVTSPDAEGSKPHDGSHQVGPRHIAEAKTEPGTTELGPPPAPPTDPDPRWRERKPEGPTTPPLIIQGDAPPKPRARPRGWMVAGVALVGLAGGAAVYASRQGGEPARDPVPAASPTQTTTTAPAVAPAVSVQPKPPTGPLVIDDAADSNPFVNLPKTMQPLQAQEHEVTNGEYATYLASLADAKRADATPANWQAPPAHTKRPVTGVTGAQAVAYCGSIGAHLPKYSEWSVLWFNVKFAKPIATQRALDEVKSNAEDRTEFGVHDVGGSVSEWTVDDRAPASAAAPTRFAPRGGNHTLTVSVDDPPAVAGPHSASIGFRCMKAPGGR